jgi:acyl-CoA thioester hydrolase
MTHPFRYYLRVRYSECDSQKVVFNSRYSDYADLASVEFMRAIGFGQALITGELDYQLVKQTLEWKAPARFDQVLELSVQAARLGNTSFTLTTSFRLAGEEPVRVMAETVYVLVDAHTLAKRSLPDDFRAALTAGAPDQVTDHAGYLRSAPRLT